MLAQYEKIVRGTGHSSFACRRFDSPSFTTPWHFHPEYELTLIVESRGQRFVGDSIASFAAGDLVLLGPNVPHCWLNLPPSGRPRRGAPVERARSVVVQFPGDLFGGWLDYPEMSRIGSLLRRRAPRGVCFSGPGAARIAARLRALPDLRGLDRLLELLGLLDGLARLPPRAASALASDGFSPALNLEQAGRLERVCRFVHQNFQRPLRQTEAAALAHLSPEAFSRFFRQKTGRTFVDYLADVRVGEACRLLIEQDSLGVTEICYACGFGNVSNFNRHFRRRHGAAPREYRRQYLK
jgi:AraC-like DNA-binding protein